MEREASDAVDAIECGGETVRRVRPSRRRVRPSRRIRPSHEAALDEDDVEEVTGGAELDDPGWMTSPKKYLQKPCLRML